MKKFLHSEVNLLIQYIYFSLLRISRNMKTLVVLSVVITITAAKRKTDQTDLDVNQETKASYCKYQKILLIKTVMSFETCYKTCDGTHLNTDIPKYKY